MIICDTQDGGFRELKRVTVPNLSWANHLQFSPSDGRYLLAASDINGTLLILDAKTGDQPAWGECCRAVALLAGQLHWHTVRRVPPLAEADESSGVSASRPLFLQAAVGSELHFIDVTAFIRNFEEDRNFSVEQLNRLSDSSPDAIPAFLEKWPHVINLRDPQSGGDTVLHHCAREGYPKATEKWLSGAIDYELLPNHAGRTALEVAAESQRSGIIRELITTLSPNLRLATTGRLTRALELSAMQLSGELVATVEALQDSKQYNLFRTQRSDFVFLRQRLDGVDGSFRHHLDCFAVRGTDSPRLDKAEWSDHPMPTKEAGGKATRCSTELTVLALRGFAGAPTAAKLLPPYTTLFKAGKGLPEEEFNTLLNQQQAHGCCHRVQVGDVWPSSSDAVAAGVLATPVLDGSGADDEHPAVTGAAPQ